MKDIRILISNSPHPVSETSEGGLSVSVIPRFHDHGKARAALAFPLVSDGVLVRVVEFERYAFDEIPQAFGTSDDIRVWEGGRATYGDGPPTGVGLGSRFSLLWGEDAGCVPVDSQTTNA